MRIAMLLILLPVSVQADACLTIDSSRSEARFEILQAGARFTDTFETLGGEVCLSGSAVTKISAWLDPASVRTGLAELDDALMGDAFFDVETYPRATFESDAIEKTEDGFVAHGTLEMKGVQKPFDLPFTLEKAPDGYRASGETTLRRLEYNIGTGEWADTQWLSDEVDVAFLIVTK